MENQTFRSVTVTVFFGLVVSLIAMTTLVGPSRSEVVFPSAFNPLQVALLAWYPANQTAGFAVGNAPFGAAFDGANIWVANNTDNTVTKLRASDGTVLGTFAVGVRPGWVAFDGSSIWVSNSVSNSVTKLRASDGTVLGTFPAGNPGGVAFDGADIWIA